MSTEQATLMDIRPPRPEPAPEPRRIRNGLIPAIRKPVVIQSFETDESRSCQRCGAHVSSEYRRVHGDDEGRVFGCPHCYGQAERLNGATQYGDDGEKEFIGGGL